MLREILFPLLPLFPLFDERLLDLFALSTDITVLSVLFTEFPIYSMEFVRELVIEFADGSAILGSDGMGTCPDVKKERMP